MPAQSPRPFAVMIVEDHPDQRALLEIILQKEGYRVLSAENGLEAWKKLEKDDAQLVLLDIMLLKMDGLEVIRRIRDDDRLKDIDIIVVTARSRARSLGNFPALSSIRTASRVNSRLNTSFRVFSTL